MKQGKVVASRVRRSTLLDARRLARWIAERPIWQMDRLDARELARFSSERGVSILESDIEQLWQLGLIKADLVLSSTKLRRSGMTYLLTESNGRHVYSDERKPSVKGSLSRIQPLKPQRSTIQPLFHPFRFYVLYHINRVFELNTYPINSVVHREWFRKAIDRHLQTLDKWLRSVDGMAALERWNDITCLAVAAEPCFYGRLFGVLKGTVSRSLDSTREAIAHHWKDISRHLVQLGLDRIEAARRELCFDAERLDENLDVYTMLRLAKGDTRLKLRGRLGGAICLWTMAEMLRRATEDALGTTLVEETDVRMPWTAGKERLFGSSRVFDGDSRVADEFLRWHELDYGVRVHWYVEGDTEYGALAWATAQFGLAHIELMNLRGHVAQKHIVSFRENLLADLKSGTFSLISIDGDRVDFLRAVTKAAEADEICGEFYVSKPDFEFQNFSVDELEEILWREALKRGANPQLRERLHRAVATTTNGSDLFASARNAIPELSLFSKDKYWGECLMRFALESPDRDAKPRQVIQALRTALQARSVSYDIHRKEYRISPTTGNLAKRSIK